MFAVLLKHHSAATQAREFASKVASATSAPAKLVQLWRSSASELRNFLIQKRQQLAKAVDPATTPTNLDTLSASGHQDLTQFYAFVTTVIERCQFLLKLRVPVTDTSSPGDQKRRLQRQTSVDVKERSALLRRTGIQASSGKSQTAEDAQTVPSQKGNWRSASSVQPKSALRSLYDKLQKRSALSNSRAIRVSALEEDDGEAEFDVTAAAGELVKGTIDTNDLWKALQNR